MTDDEIHARCAAVAAELAELLGDTELGDLFEAILTMTPGQQHAMLVVARVLEGPPIPDPAAVPELPEPGRVIPLPGLT